MSSTGSLLMLLGLAVMTAAKLQIPKIQRLQHQTEVLSAQNPANGATCFSVYRPKLDRIAEQYEVQYNLCDTQYESQVALENANWQRPREQLAFRGSSSCNRIADCASIVSSVQVFECYAEVGSDESKTMYGISANATEVKTEMEKQYQKLNLAKTICINNAERAYVEYTTVTYEALNNCLSGKIAFTTPPTYATTGIPTVATDMQTYP